ncbi:hypothetical protein AXI59_00615 [Bacillus nakamurai]|uniref:hypothetical protein n=1 Tax=Bacillus nakamurai TaxID=1793963 RepID=UPI0007784514|nr:hypothetical protein [Bacillus nakamurai]KXZ21088.1 hypothetical protein AXI59_00615 [Bacillus nakamurai]
MWIQNTDTGSTWFVEDKHGNKLLKEDRYKKVQSPIKKAEKNSKKAADKTTDEENQESAGAAEKASDE